MILHQAYLHIFDKNSGNLLLSQKELPLSNPYITEYFTKIIEKTLKSDPRHGVLPPEEPLLGFLADDSIPFIEKTQQLAHKLYEIIAPAEDIPAADYVFASGINDQGGNFFAILRLDYSSKYTHFLDYEDDQVLNTVLQNHAILPNPSQKLSEAFIVDTSNGQYQLIERKYIVEGKKIPYFSEQFLEITPPISTQEQIKEIKKTVTHVAKKYDEENYLALATTQQAIFTQLEESDEIDAGIIFDTVFKDKPLAKEAAYQAIATEKIPEKIPVTNVPKYEKKYSKQKFKLDNGIEITIPSDIYENKEMVEFINNPDGSISVLIKNIDSIMNRFNA